MELVNAYLSGGDVVLLSRDGDRLVRKTTTPEWVVYLDADEVGEDFARQLSQSRFVRSFNREGKWLRVGWVDKLIRDEMLYGRRGSDPRPSPFAERGISTYEGDVHPVRRFLTDTGATIASPRRCYFDLETDSRVPFSRKEQARILSWAIVAEDGRTWSAVLDADENTAERDLLWRFFEAAEQFDQALAWNGEGFDFPVLRARVGERALRVDMDRWLWLDHLLLFKRMNTASESGEEKQSLKLQDVAMALLKEGKDDFDGSKTWQAWAAGGAERERLLRYNVKDTELLRKIEAKTGSAALFDTVAQVTRVFPDTRGLNPTQQMDGFMLREGMERGVHFPTKRYREGVPEQYAGAYVMEPKTRGIERDVHVADFASLYPSIILTWNMSPETKVDSPVNGPILPGQCRSPKTRQHFLTGTTGILPDALKRMLDMRREWNGKKAELPPGTAEWFDADRRSTAYKVVANSFYGVVGSSFSRFFDKRIAESVTLNGQWLIQRTIEEAENRGMFAIYADSVTGDRTIVVKDAHGDVDTIPMEEIWERSKAKGVRADGKQTAALPGWRALARDASGKVDWFPIDSIVRHKTPKRLFRISTRRGQTEVTEDHGIMVGDDPLTPAQFLGSGSSFDCLKPPPVEETREVDLWAYLRRASLALPYKGRIVERRFELIDGDEWIVLGGWGSPSHKIRRRYPAKSPELHALLRLIGAYVAEGSASLRGVTSCRYMWSLSQNDPRWLEALKTDLELVTPSVKTFGPHKTAGAYVLRSGTATLSAMFATLCGFKSRAKKLPSFIHNLCSLDFGVFLNTLVEGDGSVYRQVRSTQLSYTTISQRLIASLSYALAQRGYEHAIHYRPEKASWTIRTRPVGSERVNRQSVPKVEVRDADEWVYDLSVPGANTFVDGVGRVLLHNTDSLFVKGATRTQFEAFVEWCNAELYPKILAEQGCAENFVKLAYEKQFRRIVFTSAKRYAGQYAHYKGKDATKDSKAEIKGLEYKRGDVAVLARQLQERVIRRMVVEGDERPETYREMLGEVLQRVLNDELPVEHVAVSKSVTKRLDEYASKAKADGSKASVPVHVRVAKMLAERGAEVGEGTRVAYVVLDGDGGINAAIPAEDYDGTCDRYYLWENLIYPPTQRFLQAAFPESDWRTALERVRPPKPRGGKRQASEEQLGLLVTGIGRGEFVVSVWEDAGHERALEALKEAAKRHPGGMDLVLHVCLTSGAVAVVKTMMKVSGTPAFLLDVERAFFACAASRELEASCAS